MASPWSSSRSDAGGNPANPASAKTVTLTKVAGPAGTLGGGARPARSHGQSSVTISGVTYSQAATGVVIRAPPPAPGPTSRATARRSPSARRFRQRRRWPACPRASSCSRIDCTATVTDTAQSPRIPPAPSPGPRRPELLERLMHVARSPQQQPEPLQHQLLRAAHDPDGHRHRQYNGDANYAKQQRQRERRRCTTGSQHQQDLHRRQHGRLGRADDDARPTRSNPTSGRRLQRHHRRSASPQATATSTSAGTRPHEQQEPDRQRRLLHHRRRGPGRNARRQRLGHVRLLGRRHGPGGAAVRDVHHESATAQQSCNFSPL